MRPAILARHRSDAGRCQRIAGLAHLERPGSLLIRRARKLYSDTDPGLDLTNTVYTLDATTIDLCLSLFDWAPFRTAKAAVKMHTLLDLRGAIPAFVHISDGKMHEVSRVEQSVHRYER
jgi:hypothetical protein